MSSSSTMSSPELSPGSSGVGCGSTMRPTTGPTTGGRWRRRSRCRCRSRSAPIQTGSSRHGCGACSRTARRCCPAGPGSSRSRRPRRSRCSPPQSGRTAPGPSASRCRTRWTGCSDHPGNVVWLTEAQVAQRLRELKEDSTAWLGRSFSGQFSLAGAQAKTALLRQDGRWGVPSGSTPTTHILKPAVSGFDDHDLNEHLCLDAARRAGLIGRSNDDRPVRRRNGRRRRPVRPCGPARPDRSGAPGGSLSGVWAFPLRRSTRTKGAPGQLTSPPSCGAPCRPAPAEGAVWRFADALIWNWLIGGTDGHAKNYSVLLADDDVRLAPLYDVASALPYDTHESKAQAGDEGRRGLPPGSAAQHVAGRGRGPPSRCRGTGRPGR